MTRKMFNILCIASCSFYPFSLYGDIFGNFLSQVEHDVDHISVPAVRGPNPAARPVPTASAPNPAARPVPTASAPNPAARPLSAASAETLAVGASVPDGGGLNASGGPVLHASGRPVVVGQQAPVARPGVIGLDTGRAYLTDPQRPSTESYGRGAGRPDSRVAPQRGEVHESLHREPSREPALTHHSASAKSGSRPAAHPMAGHTSGEHHAASQPYPAHTVQRSVAKLNQVGQSGQHRASSPHR
jgi:hypothetical protein